MGKGNREDRIRIAQETLEILKKGYYENSLKERIDISEALSEAIQKSILYKPSMLQNINKDDFKVNTEPIIEITDETTISAARRLAVENGLSDTVCLNFASAKNPGGGFLTGSQAQEESLARSSGLYPCISQMTEMYEYNKGLKTCLYSDYMIYSPKVPVFRDDNDKLLEQPYLVSFITAPAVNAGVVREREAENVDKIHSVMLERIKKLLWIAASNGDKSIVLGAFGCGVFKNKTEDVAEYFRSILLDEGFKYMFDRITFAIYDNSQNREKIRIFEKALNIH